MLARARFQASENLGMNFKKPKKPVLIEAALFLLEHQSREDVILEPWREALRRLQAGDVESAAEVAARAYHNGASLEDRRGVIDLISQVAIENKTHGHWFESLLLLAAEGGLSSCAYNVGLLILERAKTANDHALAHRYFTQAATNATDAATKASALVNSCEPIRDGLITGRPDWQRAVEIYEQAAELNIAVGMFNAGNVSCWLKDKGQFAYAARAVKWFTHLINRVDTGGTFVDLGGDAEVHQVYQMAKSRLAELHALNQVEVVDVDLILAAAKAEPDSERAAWLLSRAYEFRLRRTAVQAKPAAWENWLSVLSLLGWELDAEPVPMDLGPGSGDSRVLTFKRDQGAPLALAVVDLDEIENNGGVYRLVKLANNVKAVHPGPCLTIGAKGLFVQIDKADGHSSYTVFVSTNSEGVISLIPIWPGATTDDVAKLVDVQGPKYAANNTDEGNTIAILVNALGTGTPVDGKSFPEAIYVNVGGFFNSPVLTVEQARSLGCELPAKDLADALAGVKAYFRENAQRQRRYLGHQ
ncbi:hypothetical protein B7H20_28770 [Pseudomonas aeruginosa]|nr:hypothetical protein B7H20_28770 [Pseudomonas aeruginosa]